ncbi:MAG TPA: 3-hydroxyacyl-CoA dehydrogenase [Jiangellaceae bacterium]
MAPLDLNTPVGIVGAGTMGAGIAQVAGVAGHQVRIHDDIPGVAAEAIDRIQRQLTRLADKGRLDARTAERAGAALTAVGSITDLAGCGLVVEAIVEDLTAKQELFTRLETVCGPDAILASNTSSLSITDIAADLESPERVAGLHFFNPAPLLPLVEVVRGEATSQAIADVLSDTAAAWGKQPVQCTSTPGFIVNRVARPYYAEAFRLLSEDVIDPPTLDAVLREAGGFRMGPCELTDLIGQDINAAVTRSVWKAFDRDPRFEPSEFQDAMVAAGRLGQKSGGGFYEGTSKPEPATAGPCPQPDHVTVNGGGGPLEALVQRLERSTVLVRRSRDFGPIRIRPADDVVMQLTDGRTAAQVTAETGQTTIVIDLALDFATAQRIAIAAPVGAPPPAVEVAAGCLQAAGADVTVLADTPGLVVARTVAMLAAFGSDAVAAGVASAQDVDTAMRLGVNYPRGPVEWGEDLGWDWVVGVLDALSALDARRYRVPEHLCQPAPEAANNG